MHSIANTASKWLLVLVSGLIPSSVYFSLSSSVVYFTYCISHALAGASGHTVSLLAVTLVVVLECSTEGDVRRGGYEYHSKLLFLLYSCHWYMHLHIFIHQNVHVCACVRVSDDVSLTQSYL